MDDYLEEILEEYLKESLVTFQKEPQEQLQELYLLKISPVTPEKNVQ